MLRRLGTVTGAFVALAAGSALCAQDEKPAGDSPLRARVLKRIESWLEQDDSHVRREIQRILDEELGPGTAPRPPDAGDDASAATAGPAAWLGVVVEPLEEDERVALDLADDEGVRIVEIQADSPAARAGLEREDVLIRAGRRRVGDPWELRAAIRTHKPGEALPLVFLREGDFRRVRVLLAAAPARPGAAAPAGSAKAPDAAAKSPKPAAPARTRPPSGDAFDIDTFIDDLFDGPAERGNPLQQYLQTLRGTPEGEAILEFLREELRDNLPLLRQHAERGEDGRWRLRRDSAEFLKSWLEDEVTRHGKTAEDKEKEKAKDKPDKAAAKDKPKDAKAGPAAPAPKVRVGVFVRGLAPDAAKAAGLAGGTGFAILRVAPGGPADKAGLRPGDVVAKIDGQDATDAALQAAVSRSKPGDTVTLTVIRKGGAKEEVKITLDAAP